LFEGDTITAEKFIKRAIDIEPTSTYINWWAGAAFSSMLNSEMAMRQFDRVLTLNPHHLSAQLWTALLFTGLGYYDGAKYWLDRVEAIAPNNPEYLWRRANTYALGGAPEDYQALVERWVRQDPNNLDAQRYLPFATSKAAKKAWNNENMQSFAALNRKALDENLAYIKSDADDQGNFTVRPNSSWNFLAAAIHARKAGDDALANQLLKQVIDYHESQPVGASSSRNMQMMMAHAMLGQNDEAITYARAMGKEGYRAIWLIDGQSYSVLTDPYHVFNGLSNDIAFQNVVATLMRQNEETLARLRKEVPGIFPPSG